MVDAVASPEAFKESLDICGGDLVEVRVFGKGLELGESRFKLNQGAIPNNALHGSTENQSSLTKGDFEIRLLVVPEEIIDGLGERVATPQTGEGTVGLRGQF